MPFQTHCAGCGTSLLRNNNSQCSMCHQQVCALCFHSSPTFPDRRKLKCKKCRVITKEDIARSIQRRQDIMVRAQVLSKWANTSGNAALVGVLRQDYEAVILACSNEGTPMDVCEAALAKLAAQVADAV